MNWPLLLIGSAMLILCGVGLWKAEVLARFSTRANEHSIFTAWMGDTPVWSVRLPLGLGAVMAVVMILMGASGSRT